MTSLDRATLISRGAKGGLLLAVGGGVLAAAACDDDDGAGGSSTTAPSTAAPMGDAAIGKLAATAELLAIDFYAMSIASGFFGADRLAYLAAARANEEDHYDALARVLGRAETPKNLTFTYPEGTFASAKSIATTGTALEEAFVGAYLGAVTALADNGLKKVAAQIGDNEAQHLTTFRSLAAGGSLVPNPSFPKVLTAQEATAAVSPFLG